MKPSLHKNTYSYRKGRVPEGNTKVFLVANWLQRQNIVLDQVNSKDVSSLIKEFGKTNIINISRKEFMQGIEQAREVNK